MRRQWDPGQWGKANCSNKTPSSNRNWSNRNWSNAKVNELFKVRILPTLTRTTANCQQAHQSSTPGCSSGTNWKLRPLCLNTLRHTAIGFRPSYLRRVASGPCPMHSTVLSFPSHPRAGEELGTQAKQLRVGISCSLAPNFRELPGLFDSFPSSEASAASPSSWSQLVMW